MRLKIRPVHFAIVSAGLLLALIAFRLGFGWTYHTPKRDPAAIERAYDFSNFSGDELNAAIRGRLVEAAKVVNLQGEWGVELGSFLLKNKIGEIVSACEFYSTVILRFSGVGMFVSGAPSRMSIEGRCKDTEYLNRISPQMVPFLEIYKLPVHDQVYQKPTNSLLKVTFSNVSDSWPNTWALDSIELNNSSGDKITVDRDEMKSILGKYLEIQLPQ